VGVFAKILQILAVVFPPLIEWWKRREAAQQQADADARNAAIRANPSGEWLSGFNSRANQQPGDDTDKAGPDKP